MRHQTNGRKFSFMKKVIIVGAGLSGCTAGRILAEAGFSICILEQREHIGGNAFDYKDKNGILVHKYGPHIFHTNNIGAFYFLSRFSGFISYEHKVLGYVDSNFIPVPFNLCSLKIAYKDSEYQHLREILINKFGFGARVPISELRKEKEVSLLAEYIYEKVFFNYSKKQWGMEPELLDNSVTVRVPVVVSEDCRYFNDSIQVIPQDGYTQLIKNMLDHENIEVVLNCDAREHINLGEDTGTICHDGTKFKGVIIYTGCIDELLGYRYGVLPYRSLEFEFKTFKMNKFQPSAVVNYPNDNEYTRITEFKQFYPESSNSRTVVAYEYPCSYNGKNIPYYPVPQSQNEVLYFKYKSQLEGFKNLYLLGRLGEYRYYNMDVAVQRGMDVARMVKNNFT